MIDATSEILRCALRAIGRTLFEGERDDRTLAEAVARDDHLAHAQSHLHAHADGLTDEDHLAHALTRLAMEIVRREQK